MKSFEYGDEKISGKEIMIAIPSMVISVGILSLPRNIAAVMIGSDGWIVLVIGGAITVFMVWVMAKLAASFSHQSFLTYASSIVSKPIAVVLTFLFAILYINAASYEMRVIGSVSQQYLFNHTPLEVIILSFLLVVVYAVSGSRAALFRLNMLFLPFVLIIMMIVLLFNIKWIDWTNLLPMFQTDIRGYVRGTISSTLSYAGISILLFYVSMVDRPKRVPKLAMIGMTIPIALYLLIYLFCLMVFDYTATSQLLFPTIGLAKRIEIPGGILERVESIFFIVWTMGVFNTTVMAFDVTVLALQSIFRRINKIKLIFLLSPLTYYISLLPKDYSQITIFGNAISTSLIVFSFLATISLIVTAKIRGVWPNAKKKA